MSSPSTHEAQVRAFEALAAHPRVRELGTLAKDVALGSATARRTLPDGDQVKARATELGLGEDDCATPMGNALPILARGPHNEEEAAILAALFAHGLAAATPRSREEEDRLAADVLWLAVHTPFDGFGLLDRALGTAATDFWDALADVLRRVEQGAVAGLGPREAQRGLEALASSSSGTAKSHVSALEAARKSPSVAPGGTTTAPSEEAAPTDPTAAEPRAPSSSSRATAPLPATSSPSAPSPVAAPAAPAGSAAAPPSAREAASVPAAVSAPAASAPAAAVASAPAAPKVGPSAPAAAPRSAPPVPSVPPPVPTRPPPPRTSTSAPSLTAASSSPAVATAGPASASNLPASPSKRRLDDLPADEARLTGELASVPRGPFVTALFALTGLLLLAHVVRLVLRVGLAYRRPAEVTWGSDTVRIRSRTEILGRTLRRTDVVLQRTALARATREVRYPRIAFYAGLLALAAGSYLGMALLVDGARAASPSLLLTGFGVIAMGVGLDFMLQSLLPGALGVCRVVLLPKWGRPVCVAGVDPQVADEALALFADPKRAA